MAVNQCWKSLHKGRGSIMLRMYQKRRVKPSSGICRDRVHSADYLVYCATQNAQQPVAKTLLYHDCDVQRLLKHALRNCGKYYGNNNSSSEYLL